MLNVCRSASLPRRLWKPPILARSGRGHLDDRRAHSRGEAGFRHVLRVRCDERKCFARGGDPLGLASAKVDNSLDDGTNRLRSTEVRRNVVQAGLMVKRTWVDPCARPEDGARRPRKCARSHSSRSDRVFLDKETRAVAPTAAFRPAQRGAGRRNRPAGPRRASQRACHPRGGHPPRGETSRVSTCGQNMVDHFRGRMALV